MLLTQLVAKVSNAVLLELIIELFLLHRGHAEDRVRVQVLCFLRPEQLRLLEDGLAHRVDCLAMLHHAVAFKGFIRLSHENDLCGQFLNFEVINVSQVPLARSLRNGVHFRLLLSVGHVHCRCAARMGILDEVGRVANGKSPISTHIDSDWVAVVLDAHEALLNRDRVHFLLSCRVFFCLLLGLRHNKLDELLKLAE